MNAKQNFLIATAVLCLGAIPALAAEPDCGKLPAQIAGAYKGLYFANDFGYLESPCLAVSDPRDKFTKATDRLKGIDLGSGLKLDLGGEYRLRYHDENNMAATRLSGEDNAFALSRLRVYADLEAGEHLRFYGEAIDARSFGENRAPRNIEVDELDLQNGFAEFKTGLGGGKAYARAGRQELLFGVQRLISPLDWGNTRRSFDGFSGGYSIGDLKIDAFGVWPRTVKPHALDASDDSQRFTGVYASKGNPKARIFDVYLLNLREKQGALFDFDLWTFGGRGAGGFGAASWEVEGGYQWGDHDQEGRQRAGFLTMVAGYSLALPWKPKLEAGFDWASGDKDGSDGKRQTFNQLFPLAHAYLGYMDLVARQNIAALNLRASAQPLPPLTLQLTGFNFRLDSRTDALYNAGGGAIRRDITGAAGKKVGNELDLVARYAFTPRIDLVTGLSRFWAAGFVDATNPIGVSGNASFFYSQLSARF